MIYPRQSMWPILLLLLKATQAFLSEQHVSSQNLQAKTTTLFETFDPKSLLYAEHEKLLVQRGKLEGELLLNSQIPPIPIETNVVKGAGGGGGFGNGGNSKKSLLKTQGKAHAQVLKEKGVVRIDSVLPADLADEIRTNVYEMRKESEHLVKSGQVPSLTRFADVLLKENRCDMTIPLGVDDEEGVEWIAKALASVLNDSAVGSIIQTLLGNKAILYEWSCLMSDPSSNRQVLHPDTPYKEDAVLYTCFIALQDISLDMGPTTWIPETHNSPELHAQFQDETKKDQLIASRPSVLGTLPKGSCAIFDSRLLHAGGANTSNNSRALLYFTFQNPKITNVGNPGSIRPYLIGQWTLQKLQQELGKYQKGKTSQVFASS